MCIYCTLLFSPALGISILLSLPHPMKCILMRAGCHYYIITLGEIRYPRRDKPLAWRYLYLWNKCIRVRRYFIVWWTSRPPDRVLLREWRFDFISFCAERALSLARFTSFRFWNCCCCRYSYYIYTHCVCVCVDVDRRVCERVSEKIVQVLQLRHWNSLGRAP